MNQSHGKLTNKAGHFSSCYYLLVDYPSMGAGIVAFLVCDGSNDGAGLHPFGGCYFNYQLGRQMLHALQMHFFFEFAQHGQWRIFESHYGCYSIQA
jgi:hypothetical protein